MPIERGETLSEQACNRLRLALASGTFKPGESLSIRQLAGLLGVSATPARDAIYRALWDRSLESGPNHTVVVPKLTIDNVNQIYVVRINLEGLATELATPNFNRPEIAKLEAVHAAYCKAVDAGNHREALQTNENFHFFIYEQCNNTLLIEIIKSLWLKMGPSLNLLFPAYLDRRGTSHKLDILKALRKRSGADARAAIEADLVDGRAEIRRALSAADPVVKPTRKRSKKAA
jgi:DNA-binding GntR family transcriptional regulator